MLPGLGPVSKQPKKKECGFLGGILGVANKQAKKNERMQKLKTGTFMGNDARMYTKIAPKVDGRI